MTIDNALQLLQQNLGGVVVSLGVAWLFWRRLQACEEKHERLIEAMLLMAAKFPGDMSEVVKVIKGR